MQRGLRPAAAQRAAAARRPAVPPERWAGPREPQAARPARAGQPEPALRREPHRCPGPASRAPLRSRRAGPSRASRAARARRGPSRASARSPAVPAAASAPRPAGRAAPATSSSAGRQCGPAAAASIRASHSSRGLSAAHRPLQTPKLAASHQAAGRPRGGPSDPPPRSAGESRRSRGLRHGVKGFIAQERQAGSLRPSHDPSALESRGTARPAGLPAPLPAQQGAPPSAGGPGG